jgi:hypothetical protein
MQRLSFMYFISSMHSQRSHTAGSSDQGITCLFQYSVSVIYFSWTWNHITGELVPDISRQHTSGIFKGWDVQEELCTQVGVCRYRDGVTSPTFQHLKMNSYTVSKCWKPITLWCGVASHKNQHLSYTTAKTKKNLQSLLYIEEPIMSSYFPDEANPQPHTTEEL